MKETKYGKYIITDTPAPPIHPRPRIDDPNTAGTNVILINNELNGTMKEAFYLNLALMWKKTKIIPPFQQHAHDYNEYIVFQGSNPSDPFDLCGEVEIWLGDEKHIITKSCAVFVPKGLYHTPVIFHRVDKPIFYFTTAPITHYPYPVPIKDPPPEGYGKI